MLREQQRRELASPDDWWMIVCLRFLAIGWSYIPWLRAHLALNSYHGGFSLGVRYLLDNVACLQWMSLPFVVLVLPFCRVFQEP